MIDLFSPGAYARTAGGNQEIPLFQEQAVKWIAWSINADNGGNGDPAVWDKARTKWNNASIQNFPWLHCRSIQDVERLIDVAEFAVSPAIGCNIENVVTDGLSLREVGGILLDYWVDRYERPVHMATLPWVQNGQGWQHVSFAVAALEFFPDEQVIWPGGVYSQKVADDCLDHAFEEGLTKVTTMLKTKGYSPAEYGTSFSVCHSLYTSDDIPPTQQGWAVWKPTAAPCIRLEENTVPLTPTQKKKFRENLRRFCLVAQANDEKWHYTQQRPYTGLGAPASDTHYNDCSSYVAIAFFRAGRNAGVRVDDPLGYHYVGWGNTGTCYNEMKKYPAPKDKYRIGDVALYLQPGGFEDHMTVCIKEGTGATAIWSSFGTEAGPDERSLHYRSDLTGVYRPEDLR